jgi:hypothetical protein
MKEAAIQQELRDLNILASLVKVLFIGHAEPKLMPGQLIEGCLLDVLNEMRVASHKSLIVSELALPDCARD